MGASSSLEERYTVVPGTVCRRVEPQLNVVCMQAETNDVRMADGRRVETRTMALVAVTGGGQNVIGHRAPARPLPQLAPPVRREKCTYDAGLGSMQQMWYQCLTCWGAEAGGSRFGFCSACAVTCHSGHQVQSRGLATGECDCGTNKHQSAVCTWHVTKCKPVAQPFYVCPDCFTAEARNEYKSVCYQCMKNCHRSHYVRNVGVRQGFCLCGATSCRIKCSIQAPA